MMWNDQRYSLAKVPPQKDEIPRPCVGNFEAPMSLLIDFFPFVSLKLLQLERIRRKRRAAGTMIMFLHTLF